MKQALPRRQAQVAVDDALASTLVCCVHEARYPEESLKKVDQHTSVTCIIAHFMRDYILLLPLKSISDMAGTGILLRGAYVIISHLD